MHKTGRMTRKMMTKILKGPEKNSFSWQQLFPQHFNPSGQVLVRGRRGKARPLDRDARQRTSSPKHRLKPPCRGVGV